MNLPLKSNLISSTVPTCFYITLASNVFHSPSPDHFFLFPLPFNYFFHIYIIASEKQVIDLLSRLHNLLDLLNFINTIKIRSSYNDLENQI